MMYLRTVCVTSVLAHCTVIHSVFCVCVFFFFVFFLKLSFFNFNAS